MDYLAGRKLKPLQIRFDIYHDSEDFEFRYELVTLMAGSIRELQASATSSYRAKNSEAFKKGVHKAKSTLVLLDDQDMNAAVEDFKHNLGAYEKGQQQLSQLEFDRFNRACEVMIDLLENEARLFKEKI